MSFFVILNHPNGGVVPLVDGPEDRVATFTEQEAAVRAIADNILGQAYGGKVFDTDEPVVEG